jgi:hypothetical protein
MNEMRVWRLGGMITTGGKPKYSKEILEPLCPPKIPHILAGV